MSEIASKANTGPSASLAQPFAKKGAGAEHDLLFAALFGGVVAAETDTDPMAGGLAPVDADADTTLTQTEIQIFWRQCKRWRR